MSFLSTDFPRSSPLSVGSRKHQAPRVFVNHSSALRRCTSRMFALPCLLCTNSRIGMDTCREATSSEGFVGVCHEGVGAVECLCRSDSSMSMERRRWVRSLKLLTTPTSLTRVRPTDTHGAGSSEAGCSPPSFGRTLSREARHAHSEYSLQESRKS